MNAQIEKAIKRSLSAAELAAIKQIANRLPLEPRKRKRMLRVAREHARREELRGMARDKSLREPTDEELQAAKGSLAQWKEPLSFIAEVEKLARAVPTSKLWGNRYKFLREAITVAEFCKHSEVTEVRLGNDPPDALVRFKPGEDVPVEVTEVQEPGRKRGDEYKQLGVQAATYVPESDVASRTEMIVAALENAVATKAEQYDFAPLLIVYLNFPHDRRGETAIRKAIRSIQDRFADRLRNVHVVTDRTFLG
jgi:hypothetical protein